MSAKIYFVCKECPLKGDCSHDSFKRAAVWAWCSDGCRKKLANHLQRSSHHQNMAKEDIPILVADAAIEEQEEEPEPAAKKQKPLPPPPPPAPAPAADELVDRTAATVLARLEAQGFPSASASNLGPDIMVRASDFQAIMDCVQRASTAVKAAQRLAATAARSFGDGGEALASVKEGLETIATASEFDYQIRF
jgi:type IV secretory pathway VirB10-like protein